MRYSVAQFGFPAYLIMAIDFGFAGTRFGCRVVQGRGRIADLLFAICDRDPCADPFC